MRRPERGVTRRLIGLMSVGTGLRSSAGPACKSFSGRDLLIGTVEDQSSAVPHPGAQSRLIAKRAATRDHGTSAFAASSCAAKDHGKY